MSIPIVKICGLQSVEVLKSILHLPIDYLGFVFAKSRRQVTVEQARNLIDYVRVFDTKVPLTVGVFVNPTKEELELTQEIVALDVIQLHGQESPDFCKWVKETLQVQVWKVISVSKEPLSENITLELSKYSSYVDLLLMDTAGGGTGETFAWHVIPAYRDWARQEGIPLLVAGGLTQDNVALLMKEYGPDGVDVSSGVETDGIKDITKITAFVERVKQL